MTVVADDGDVLAVRLDPGSPFTFHDHRHGQHPWSAHSAWTTTTVLQLVKKDSEYGVPRPPK